MAYLVGILIGLVVGSLAAWLVLVSFTGNKLAAARRTRQLMLTEARKEAEALRREAEIEAKEAAVTHRADVERELQGSGPTSSAIASASTPARTTPSGA